MKNKTNYSSIDEIKEVFKGKKILITMFIGEIGWELQRFQAHLRFLKNKEFPDWDFVVMCRPHMHIFYDDFVSYTLELPEWFNELNLEGDGYEAVLPGTPAGGLTPPEVYQNLVHLLNSFGEGVEDFNLLLPPRGCSMFIEHSPQFFRKFTSEECLSGDRAIITVLPRARARAPQRNVPEFIWREVVTELSKTFTVVLAGTPSGACLSDMEGPHIINLIKYNEKDKTEQIIKYLNNSVCSVSSQSGGTHISLLCGTPSYIIGHEMDRHANIENRLQAPTSFRILTDYRAIDAQTILTDLQTFIQSLFKANWFSKIDRPSLNTLINKQNLVGVEIGVGLGINAYNILSTLDIKKLYLIDPYTMTKEKGVAGYHLKNASDNQYKEYSEKLKKEAIDKLKPFEDKIEWIFDYSEFAAKLIPDDLDFVYIDGNHDYEGVKKDIELYHEKVKQGGLVAGHDYDGADVEKAVKEFYKDTKVNLGDSDWWVVKEQNIDEFDIIGQDYNKLLELV